MRRLAESHTADKGGTEPGLETRIQTASLCPLSGQALFLSKFPCYKQKHFKDIWAVFKGGIFLFQKVNSTFLVRIWREQFCLWFSNAPLLLLFSHSQNIKYGLESKSGWPKGNLESVPSEGWLSAQVLSPMKTVLWEACELHNVFLNEAMSSTTVSFNLKLTRPMSQYMWRKRNSIFVSQQ